MRDSFFGGGGGGPIGCRCNGDFLGFLLGDSSSLLTGPSAGSGGRSDPFDLLPDLSGSSTLPGSVLEVMIHNHPSCVHSSKSTCHHRLGTIRSLRASRTMALVHRIGFPSHNSGNRSSESLASLANPTNHHPNFHPSFGLASWNPWWHGCCGQTSGIHHLSSPFLSFRPSCLCLGLCFPRGYPSRRLQVASYLGLWSRYGI